MLALPPAMLRYDGETDNQKGNSPANSSGQKGAFLRDFATFSSGRTPGFGSAHQAFPTRMSFQSILVCCYRRCSHRLVRSAEIKMLFNLSRRK